MTSHILDLEAVSLNFSRRRLIPDKTPFPALKKVSFSMAKGETLGVIGRNGCGKSSLLRLLTGIYTPDSGRIVRNYKNASLLSLSLGFDRELSGRDNAILSGMLLGHSRDNVIRHLDEIIAFSELAAFIDAPIKTYSTGMRTRLGFSVAITLQVDLLLIDEVLGVGDVRFREKAIQAMSEKITGHQSVVFVSHAKTQVSKLCDRVLWLEKGQLMEIGPTQHVLACYYAFLDESKELIV